MVEFLPSLALPRNIWSLRAVGQQVWVDFIWGTQNTIWYFHSRVYHISISQRLIGSNSSNNNMQMGIGQARIGMAMIWFYSFSWGHPYECWCRFHNENRRPCAGNEDEDVPLSGSTGAAYLVCGNPEAYFGPPSFFRSRKNVDVPFSPGLQEAVAADPAVVTQRLPFLWVYRRLLHQILSAVPPRFRFFPTFLSRLRKAWRNINIKLLWLDRHWTQKQHDQNPAVEASNLEISKTKAHEE